MRIEIGVALLLVLAAPAWPHAVSFSSGDLKIDGARAHYELRMPLYEISHVTSPERTLLEHVRFAGAQLVKSECTPDKDTYVCEADYQFEEPVKTVSVECTLAAATVPNHVHLLRAEMGEKHDQALFDISFTTATLRFRPPTATEVAVSESAAGGMRALSGAVQVLFLVVLVLAARGAREMAALAGMFLLGQVASTVIAPHALWQPAPRFVEAAGALTVAYLAAEVLLLPRAGARWAVAGVLGAFHGLYFRLFVQTTSYQAGYVLLGAALAELVVTASLAAVVLRLPKIAHRVAAGGLLGFGVIWFVLRLRG
jgi:HupE / UreJ protein